MSRTRRKSWTLERRRRIALAIARRKRSHKSAAVERAVANTPHPRNTTTAVTSDGAIVNVADGRGNSVPWWRESLDEKPTSAIRNPEFGNIAEALGKAIADSLTA